MQKLLAFIFITCVASLFKFTNGDEVQVSDKSCGKSGLSPYLIVIDGGSTGSRLHIFHFSENSESTCICSRRGSSRANVPLSVFAPADGERLVPSTVAAHLLPPFEFAAQAIPPAFHTTTTVRYEATAGMRLLTEGQQTQVYDALYEGLMASESFVFRGMNRGDIETLSGDLEGFYGAVTANYLIGIIDANLHVAQDNHDTGGQETREVPTTHPVGALDMGGSSTQIVYLTEQVDNGSHSCANPSGTKGEELSKDGDAQAASNQEEYPQTCSLQDRQAKKMLQGEDFFSTSYLAYGVDQFRERLWDTLIQDRYTEDHSDFCDSKIIEYPCGFKGHKISWEEYTFFGTGDTAECIRQVQRLLPHAEEATDVPHQYAGKLVGGIEHPTVTGKFFAMSLYFFTLDSLRVLSHPKDDAHEALNLAWPRPSIEELANALEGLCSRSWDDDLADIQDNAHEFTRAEVLPHRCFESVYMVTLLRDGFGFHPHSRDIEFTFLVDGSEVEWSLGMALVLRSEDNAVVGSKTCDGKDADSNSTTGDQNGGVAIQETLISLASTMVTSSG